MPRCSLDDIAETSTDTPYSLSFPILSAWPNLPNLLGWILPPLRGDLPTVLALVQQAWTPRSMRSSPRARGSLDPSRRVECLFLRVEAGRMMNVNRRDLAFRSK